MQNTSTSTREMYPHRELGIVLLVIGVLLLIFAVVAGGYCQASGPGGPAFPSGCVYPYAAGAILLGFLGFVLLIVGIVLVASRTPTNPPVVFYPPPYWGAPPVPPPPPQVACMKCGRVYHMGLHAYCPNCGTKIGG